MCADVSQKPAASFLFNMEAADSCETLVPMYKITRDAFQNRKFIPSNYYLHYSFLAKGTASLLYNGYRVYFPGVKQPGPGADHPLHQASRLRKE
jgi:hypothetical protein